MYKLTSLAFLSVSLVLQISPTEATVVYDAGDGYSYEAVAVPTGITWPDAQAAAVAAGGYLACPTDASQNSFIYNLIDTPQYWTTPVSNGEITGPWLGASASNDYNGSDATFSWVNGSTFSYTNWYPTEPNGYPGNYPNQAIDYFDNTQIGPTWGDDTQGPASSGLILPNPNGYVIQFDSVPEPASLAVAVPALIFSLFRRRCVGAARITT